MLLSQIIVAPYMSRYHLVLIVNYWACFYSKLTIFLPLLIFLETQNLMCIDNCGLDSTMDTFCCKISWILWKEIQFTLPLHELKAFRLPLILYNIWCRGGESCDKCRFLFLQWIISLSITYERLDSGHEGKCTVNFSPPIP